MLLEEIYHKIYAEIEKTKEEDREISSQITALVQKIELEEPTQEELVDLLCKAYAFGEKRGFVSGAHFLAKLICEALG